MAYLKTNKRKNILEFFKANKRMALQDVPEELREQKLCEGAVSQSSQNTSMR